jgi:branched-chain amino acid transport system ATP-binding protein
MSGKAVLKIEGLRAGYGNRRVLFDVSARIQAGTITAIVGPNGAGKSTLLKAVAGLADRWKGSILFKERDIRECDPGEILAMGISMVPQGRCNFPLMTVQENLEMGAYTRRDSQVGRDLDAMKERFPVLEEKKNLLAGNLSGGEQQILEMAMALMLTPALLLLDEPSLGLAPGPMGRVFQEVQRIAAEGIPVIMVEQNAKRALEISDQALVLDLGTVWMSGPGKEILDNPQVRKRYLGG